MVSIRNTSFRSLDEFCIKSLRHVLLLLFVCFKSFLRVSANWKVSLQLKSPLKTTPCFSCHCCMVKHFQASGLRACNQEKKYRKCYSIGPDQAIPTLFFVLPLFCRLTAQIRASCSLNNLNELLIIFASSTYRKQEEDDEVRYL